MSERLAEAGIEVLEGYDAERLARLQPDLVVVGNVNTRGNPEVEWLLDTRKLPFVSLPELLAREILSRRPAVVVAGTHGKTTTTSIAAHLLSAAGEEPGYLIGGVPRDLPAGAAIGRAGAPFVIEGDEYDSAFFDKRSKFIHYCPRILLLNNLEFDHADIFRDLADVRRTFQHLIRLVPRSGHIVVNSDDAELESLVHIDWTRIWRVGLGERADVRIVDYVDGPDGSSFRLLLHGREWASIRWPQSGLFNARNAAMAALGAALGSGRTDLLAFPLTALETFSGVKRRQEVLLRASQRAVIADFAHHPTAVRETLRALRQRFPEYQLHMAFEARSNTSCRKVHESAFELAFDLADGVHLGPVYRAERYAAADRMDMAGIAGRLGPKGHYYPDNQQLLDGIGQALMNTAGPALAVFFSNGSFDGVPLKLAAILQTPLER